MRGLVDFFKYNNLVPITLGVIFLGAGAAAAATPEVRDAAAAAVLSQQQTVLSVDNTYIANKNLSVYKPRAQIVSVTEDDESYYVSYTLATVDLQGYVWKDVQKTEIMKVSKPDLGPYRDLGVYVTQQLKQILDRELAYLGEVQEKERKQLSQAVVATTYGGLVGQFLDTSMETLPGYEPVVKPLVEVASNNPQSSNESQSQNQNTTGTAGATVSVGSTQIGIQVLGNNPARVPLRASYVDLGAVLLDPYNTNVGLHIFLDGHETNSPSIDTSTTTSYTIEYRATDQQGSTIVARRVVLVGDAPDPGGEVSAVGNLLPAPEPTPTPVPVVAPTPAPTPTPPPVATTTPVIPTPVATTTPVVTPVATTTPVVVPEPVATSTPVITPVATSTATTTP